VECVWCINFYLSLSLSELATINLLEYLESVVKVCALARPSLSQYASMNCEGAMKVPGWFKNDAAQDLYKCHHCSQSNCPSPGDFGDVCL